MKRKISSIILLMCLMLMPVAAEESVQNYVWNGYCKENIEFPSGSGNMTTELRLGPIAARQSAGLCNLPIINGNYKLSYDIYFDSDIKTSSEKFYYFPKITSSDGEYAAIYIYEDQIYFDVNTKKIPINLSKGKWYKFIYTFYPVQKLISLTVDDGTNSVEIADENENTLFNMKCNSIESLYFYRELRGTEIVAYFDNPLVELYTNVSLKSSVYNVDKDNCLIKGVERGTVIDEFKKNIIVTDAEYTIYGNDDTEKNSGYITDGDYVVLTDGENQYTYYIIMSGYIINSSLYNIDNSELIIRGIAENSTKTDFLNNMNITGGEKIIVSNESGELSDEDVIDNGCTFYITDGTDSKTYTLKTDKAENFVYFYDDYEDNSKGGWNNGTIKTDDSTGNSYLAFDLSNAYTTIKKVESSHESEVYVSEFDIFYPSLSDYSSAIRGIYFNTPDDKIIMSLRTDNNGNLSVLDGFSAVTVYNGIVGNWHHVKMTADNISGKFDLYIDGKSVGTDYKYQAESNFKVNIIKFGFDKAERGFLKLDNFTLYEPVPIAISKISFVSEGIESFDVNNVKNDVDEIKIYFSNQKGININEDSIKNNIRLYNSDGKEIQTKGNFDSSSNIYTLKLNEILDESERYTVKAENIKDDFYQKNFNDSISFMSRPYEVKIINADMAEYENYITVNAELKNSSERNIDTEIIAVAVNEDNRIVNVKGFSYNIKGYTSENLAIDINTSEQASEIKSIRIFLKERCSSPLSDVYIVEK